jgi:Flp pilus assembly secretin CpaC
MKFKVTVKLTANSMSPAVCGLFRPAVLIPQALVENFSDGQLRAVLLHELIHLRRRDVWLNFLQALLQIFYWWHPLLWVANARIRRVREEAVDDAVMLALHDDADGYAPTLLEVAKLAFHRPLMSLGLVGIVESRSALRQRIERLVDFRAPRKAGLTFASLCGIFMFSAVALPMGEAPSPAEKQILSAPAPAISPLPVLAQKTNSPTVLVSAQFYQMPADDFKKLVSNLQFNPSRANEDPWWSASPRLFQTLKGELNISGLNPIMSPRIQTSSGTPAQMYVGNGTNGFEFDCTPLVNGGKIILTVHGEIVDGGEHIILTNRFRANTSAENSGGIVIRLENMDGLAASNLVAVIGVELVTNLPAGRFQPRLVPLPKPASAATSSAPLELVQAGKLLFEMGKLDEAQKKLEAALAAEPQNATAKYYLSLIQSNRQNQKLVYTGPGRQLIIQKLQSIRLDRVSFDGLPLGQVLRGLNEEARKRDDDRKGISFLIYNPDRQPQSPPAIDPVTGLPAATVADAAPDLMALPITIKPPLNNVTLGEVLDAVVKASPTPIYYSVEDFAIVFSAGKAAKLIPFGFKLDARALDGGLSALGKLTAGSASERFKNFFAALGINWQLPRGKTVFYNDRAGLYFVQATAEDLDTIHRALRVLYQAQLQNASPGNSTNASGILADTNFVIALRTLQQRTGVETLDEPEVTTTSGHSINRITRIISVPISKVVSATSGQKIVTFKLDRPMQSGVLKESLLAAGVKNPPTFFFYKDDGLLLVRGDPEQLALVNRLVLRLNGFSTNEIAASDKEFVKQTAAMGFEDTSATSLYMRTFRVDPNTFYSGLEKASLQNLGHVNSNAVDIGDGGPDGSRYVTTKSSTSTTIALAKAFFTKLGVNLEQPPGKSVFFNERLGYLFVKATESDLDTIERAIQVLNQVPPQIHIKARFYEVPNGTLHGFQKIAGVSNSAAQITGILNATNARTALRALEARSGIETLGEPEVTTTSGRQTQMRVTDVVTVVTNLTFQDTFTNQDGVLVTNAIVPQTNKFETGPVLDVVPYVLSDGYTINLAVIPSVTEFLGYDKSTNTTAVHNRAGEKINVPQVLPRFTVRQVATTLNLWDGQTAILGGLPETTYVNGSVVTAKPKTDDKELLVFITASVVDPAGNRIHADDELPSAQKGIPPQPTQPAQPK